MRRLIVEEPVSRAASWSSRLAWFALAVTLISVAIVRFGFVEAALGLVSLAGGLLLAAAAIGLACLAFVRIWTEGRRGLGLAARALLLAVAILAWPAWLAAHGIAEPGFDDLATDALTPPAFSRSRTALAARRGADLAAGAGSPGSLPDLGPLRLELEPAEAFAVVLEAAAKLKWQVVDQVPPGGRMGTGHLDAIDHSWLLKLPGDVAVRLRPIASGTQIDVRSRSRLPRQDLGTNAARIRRFLAAVSALAEAR
jgi:uncharacterized protein (DUF1499 family)